VLDEAGGDKKRAEGVRLETKIREGLHLPEETPPPCRIEAGCLERVALEPQDLFAGHPESYVSHCVAAGDVPAGSSEVTPIPNCRARLKSRESLTGSRGRPYN
jgi:hypothetical protein